MLLTISKQEIPHFKKIKIYVIRKFVSFTNSKKKIIVPKGTTLYIYPVDFISDLYIELENPSCISFYYPHDYMYTYPYEEYIMLSKDQLNNFTTYLLYEEGDKLFFNNPDNEPLFTLLNPTITNESFLYKQKFPLGFKDVNSDKLEFYFDKIYCPIFNMFHFCTQDVIDSFMPNILNIISELQKLEKKVTKEAFEEAIEKTNKLLYQMLDKMLSMGTKPTKRIITPKDIWTKELMKKLNFEKESEKLTKSYFEKIEAILFSEQSN